jgi:hypothetical protein
VARSAETCLRIESISLKAKDERVDTTTPACGYSFRQLHVLLTTGAGATTGVGRAGHMLLK